MAQPQPNGGGGGVSNANGGPPMIRPEQIDGLPFLDHQRKDMYKQGLARLWQAVENNSSGSSAYIEAMTKIRAASQKVMQELSQRNRATGNGAAGAGTTSSTTQQQPGQQGQQGQQRPPTQGGQGQGQGQGQGLGGQGGGGQGGGQQVALSQARQQLQLLQQQQLPLTTWSEAIQKQVLGSQVHVPLNVVGDAVNPYIIAFQRALGDELLKRERAQAVGKQAQNTAHQLTSAGQPVPEHIDKQMRNAKAMLDGASSKVKELLHRNHQQGLVNQQARQANGQQQGQVGGNGTQLPGFQGGNGQSTQQSQSHDQGASMPQQTQPPTTSQHQSLPQQSQQQQHFPQQPHPNQPQQQYPQPNPQSAAQPSIPHPPPQQQQPPQRPHPPQALSQQAAMAQAAQQYERTQTQTQPPPHNPQGMQSQPPNGTHVPFNTQPPPSSANAPTPTQQSFPQPQQVIQPVQTPNNKFPIPKILTLDNRTQQPVPGPPSRPTMGMGQQGMMAQPGLTRPQQFQLEGDGDRVLSKRKLDELVRQVCGRPGTEHEGALAPEVEESVLQLADDFVDNVITAACRLAKLRPNQTLDVKDVQIALERNYGIRIPGYSIDEVRTVRKFQPAPGWQSKMQAVQTAKTLGGVGKGDA